MKPADARHWAAINEASFVGGLIYGLIVNLVFSMAGGLEVEIENQKPY